jgi:hypothetical protein
VVPRPERDTDKRQLALDRDLRDRRQRPVAAGDAEGVDAGPRSHEGRRIVAFAEDVHIDSSLARRGRELVHCWSALPRARVDQEKARQSRRQHRPYGQLI